MLKAEFKRINVPYNASCCQKGDFARCNFLETGDGKAAAIVSIDAGYLVQKDPLAVAALLVHEAVHIWQKHAEIIGSHNDHGDEEEAYAIQAIAAGLMYEYRRQVYEAQ